MEPDETVLCGGKSIDDGRFCSGPPEPVPEILDEGRLEIDVDDGLAISGESGNAVTPAAAEVALVLEVRETPTVAANPPCCSFSRSLPPICCCSSRTRSSHFPRTPLSELTEFVLRTWWWWL